MDIFPDIFGLNLKVPRLKGEHSAPHCWRNPVQQDWTSEIYWKSQAFRGTMHLCFRQFVSASPTKLIKMYCTMMAQARQVTLRLLNIPKSKSLVKTMSAYLLKYFLNFCKWMHPTKWNIAIFQMQGKRIDFSWVQGFYGISKVQMYTVYTKAGRSSKLHCKTCVYVKNNQYFSIFLPLCLNTSIIHK